MRIRCVTKTEDVLLTKSEAKKTCEPDNLGISSDHKCPMGFYTSFFSHEQFKLSELGNVIG